MDKRLLDELTSALKQRNSAQQRMSLKDSTVSFPKPIKRVRDKTLSYSYKHRGTWHRPEYDFDEIQIAQHTDSFFSRAVLKKTNKLICAGYEFTGNNPETVSYIRRRIKSMEMATNTPFTMLMIQVIQDMFRFNNHMLVKTRDREASQGQVRRDYKGQEIEPVAGYFPLPLETLEFQTNSNGTLKKVRQRMPNGDQKEWYPRDIVHFYSNRSPGFVVGTPEMWAALDDIQLLRRIEENVEELIETNLFPVFHYRIGSDNMPERMTPEGIRESEVVKRTIEYMPASGVYVSDHRHEIQALGSEGRALRIDFYLTYFKQRVFAALGTSNVDMGEGGGATKSTASTMSEGMMMDVEAVACLIKSFFDFFIIGELMLEGGYDPTDDDQKVELRFGVINKEEKRAHENHIIQSYHGQMRDLDEARESIGLKPWKDTQGERTHYKMYEEPLAMIKHLGTPGTASGEVLGQLPQSNVTPAAVKHSEQFAKTLQKQSQAAGASGAKPNSLGTGSRKAAASRNKPSNQHGTRGTAKTNRDLNVFLSRDEYEAILEREISDSEFTEWKDFVLNRYNKLARHGVSFDTVLESAFWRLEE